MNQAIEALNEIWPIIVQLALIVTASVAAGGGVSVITDKLKNWLGWEDMPAWILSKAIPGIFSLIAAIAAGTITAATFGGPIDATVLILQILAGFGTNERASARAYTEKKMKEARKEVDKYFEGR